MKGERLLFVKCCLLGIIELLGIKKELVPFLEFPEFCT
jgi:hypothetical protein